MISTAENDDTGVESSPIDLKVESLAEENQPLVVEEAKNETDKLRTSRKKMTCLPLKGLNFTSEDENRVDVLNGTALISVLNEQSNSNVTNRTTPAICSLVSIFSKSCTTLQCACPVLSRSCSHGS